SALRRIRVRSRVLGVVSVSFIDAITRGASLIARPEGRKPLFVESGDARNMTPDSSLTVSIANQPGNIDKALEQALSRIQLNDFREKVVAIKPNDTTATPDDKTACTQADTLRGAIRFVKSLHPRSIVVSGGAGKMETAEVFKVMGFLEVIES